jgi:hypothetical protein
MIRRCLVVSLWVGLVFPWLMATASGQPPEKPKESRAAKLAAEAKALAEELKEANETVKKVADKAVREKLELQIARAELRALNLKKELDEMAAATPPVKVAMPDANFQKLLNAIKAEAFDTGKVAVVSGLKGIHLNCEQLKTIMMTFAFDEKRLDAGVHLYPMLTDPENDFNVVAAFTFESGKVAWRKAIAPLKDMIKK